MDDYFAAKATLFDGRAARAAWSASTTSGAAGWPRAHPDAVTVVHRPGHGRLARRATSRDRRRRRARPSPRSAPDGVAVPVRLRAARARSTWPTRWSRWPAWTPSGCRAAVGRAAASPSVAVPGRMQRVDAGQPFLAVVDYAHKPAAVAALLDTLRAAGARPARSWCWAAAATATAASAR